MKKHYDFSKSVRNPYAEGEEAAHDSRLDEDTMINLYLRECAESGKTLAMEWS